MKYFSVLLVTAALVASAFAQKATTPKTTTTSKKVDESIRQSRCLSNQFQCTSGQCVSQNLLCNGRNDCRDGSDESFSICYTAKTTTTERNSGTDIGGRGPFSCALGEFSCTSGECVRQDRICDGYSDCADSSDEADSICPDLPSGNGGNTNNNGGNKCLTTEFQCKNGQCIFGGYRCDGTRHCNDGSDEDWNLCQSVSQEKPATTRAPATQRPNQGGNTGNTNTGGNSNTGNSWQGKLTPCTVPPQPANGRWRLHRSLCDSGRECNAPANVRSMDPGSYLVYNCDQGFILNGTRDVLCGPGGKWVNEPQCDEIRCKPLSTSATEALCTWNNVAVSCEIPAPVGTTAQLNCRQGFVQEVTYTQAYKSVTCGTDGEWTPAAVTCVKKPKKVKLVLEGDMIIED